LGVSLSGLKSHPLEILPFTEYLALIEPHVRRVAYLLRYDISVTDGARRHP
jgi:hypothetical protein